LVQKNASNAHGGTASNDDYLCLTSHGNKDRGVWGYIRHTARSGVARKITSPVWVTNESISRGRVTSTWRHSPKKPGSRTDGYDNCRNKYKKTEERVWVKAQTSSRSRGNNHFGWCAEVTGKKSKQGSREVAKGQPEENVPE